MNIEKAEKWEPCLSPRPGNTIQWREPLWAAPSRPRGKPDKVGEQQITALLKSGNELVELEVLSLKRLSLDEGAIEPPVKINIGDLIKRKQSSLVLGDCHKLA